jgi:hypothetical protein
MDAIMQVNIAISGHGLQLTRREYHSDHSKWYSSRYTTLDRSGNANYRSFLPSWGVLFLSQICMASNVQCGCWQTTALERLAIGFKAMEVPSMKRSAHPGEESESTSLAFYFVVSFPVFHLKNTLSGPG